MLKEHDLGGIRKKKKKRVVAKQLWKYVAKHKKVFILAIILTCISNILALICPMVSGFAIDAIGTKVGEVKFVKVFIYVGMMIVFYVLSAIISYILSVLMINTSQKIVKQMRHDVMDTFFELSVEYFDQHAIGDIISRISYDIDTINTSFSHDVVQLLASVMTIIGALIMMICLSPMLVLVFVVMLPISIYVTGYLTKKARPFFSKRSICLANLNGYVEEMLSGHKTICAYEQEERIMGEFDDKNLEAVNAYYESEYHGSLTGPSVTLINNISLALISAFGAIMFLYGKMSIGQISSFVLYSRKFSGPINEAANIFTELQSSLSAAERVFSFMNEPREWKDLEDAREISSCEGLLEGKNINFGYRENKLILKDISFKANPGNMIAVVGPTGSGKSTLINLIMQFYPIKSGDIILDEKVYSNIKKASLRRQFAMVLQETWLFSGTIYENLVYGREDATLEEVIEATKAAHIHDTIEKLPNGYDTVLTDEGVSLSAGQKQLMTIARAMLLPAQMLILDEATSNVDTRTEKMIQQAMAKLMKGKTCFVIAHRLSTIRNADTILVIRDGSVVERGNHDTLLRKHGVYAGIYQAQFE